MGKKTPQLYKHIWLDPFSLSVHLGVNVHIQRKLLIAHACHGHTLQLSTGLYF